MIHLMNQNGIGSFIGKYLTKIFYFICSNNDLSYRRTNGDVLDLSEISLDLNLIDNTIRYKFTDAPILAVSIAECSSHIIVLVTTVSSLHQLKFTHPREFVKKQDETQNFSIFHGACSGQNIRDPTFSLYHVINQVSASSKFHLSISMG